MNPVRAAVFGHGLVGEAGLACLPALGVEPVVVYAHDTPATDWQRSLAVRARELGLPCRLDADPADSATRADLAGFTPDVIVSLYYRELLPAPLLAVAPRGGINLHGSPLPRYRGRAPVNWMVLNGEPEGGVALHVMTPRPDAGPLLAQRTFPIGPEETAFDVLLTIRRLGMELLATALPAWLSGDLEPVAQGRGTTFGRRRPEDGRIDWTWPSHRILNLIRAVTRPYPGAFCDVTDSVPPPGGRGAAAGGAVRRLYIWWARPAPTTHLPPGRLELAAGRLYAGTGDGALELVDYTVGGEPFGRRAERVESLCMATEPGR